MMLSPLTICQEVVQLGHKGYLTLASWKLSTRISRVAVTVFSPINSQWEFSFPSSICSWLFYWSLKFWMSLDEIYKLFCLVFSWLLVMISIFWAIISHYLFLFENSLCFLTHFLNRSFGFSFVRLCFCFCFVWFRLF